MGTAHMLSGLTHWHGSLARWGLRKAVAVHDESRSHGAAAVLVRVSGAAAATGLAKRWAELGGCQVTVLRVTGGVSCHG